MAEELGAHAAAARTREETLAQHLRATAEADQVVATTVRDARRMSQRGRRQLDVIRAEIETAVANQRSMAVDTPAGARRFTGLLAAKTQDIHRVVSGVAAHSQARASRVTAMSGRYATGPLPRDLPLGPAPAPAPGDLSSGDVDAVDAVNRTLLAAMLAEYLRLPDGRVKTDRLADIAAIRSALEVPDSHLVYLDKPDDPSQMIPAATAIGDPFNADHVSVTVPGVSGTTRQTLTRMTAEASDLRRGAQEIARKTGASQNISTVAWVGYQPPPVIPSSDTPVDRLAQAGATKLKSFLQDLNAASHNPGHSTALFGHSYGSLVSGIALRGGASAVVDNAVLYGSPGFEATSSAKLGMTDRNFFVMSAPDDPIRGVAALAPLHGWGSDPNEIIRADTTPGAPGRYRFTHLRTDAGWVDLAGEQIYKTGAHGHGDYPHDARQQMTGFNLAAILLNRPDLAARVDPP